MKAKKIKELILENPDLEIMVVTSPDRYDDVFGSTATTGDEISCYIDEYTLFEDTYVSKDDVNEIIREKIEEDNKYTGLTNKECAELFEQELNKYQFTKYIVICG